eukprot:s2878_g10.t1
MRLLSPHDTAAGEKVWVWTYNASKDDPQVFRAVAEVPSLGRTFEGDWCRGKKLAQRNACLAVKAYLDSLQSESFFLLSSNRGGFKIPFLSRSKVAAQQKLCLLYDSVQFLEVQWVGVLATECETSCAFCQVVIRWSDCVGLELSLRNWLSLAESVRIQFSTSSA